MDTWTLHKGLIRYGESMRLAGFFLARLDLRNHSRALELSTVIHRRVVVGTERKLP